MSGIFLSHASSDKDAVNRLALDLSARGIPVWFDAWNLEVSDPLTERITDGIDDSSLLVLALSPKAVTSEWVNKELRMALNKEASIGRRFILPVRLAECEFPAEIADRVFADFSGGYSAGLDRLEAVLRRHMPALRDVPLDNRIIPLRVRQGINLDGVSLQATFEHIVPLLKAGQLLGPDHIRVVPEDSFAAMRAAVGEAVDELELASHPPEVESFLRQTLETVRRLEQLIPEGVAAIANGLVQANDWAFFSMAAEWYVRLLRTELLVRLQPIWPFVHGEAPPPISSAHSWGPTSNAKAAATFFGVEKVKSFDIFPEDRSTYFKAWLDEASEIAQWVHSPQSLQYYYTPDAAFRFIVPQMVWYHQANRQNLSSIPWNLSSWMIGPA